MKGNAIARIILYSILALILLGILCAFLLADFFKFSLSIGNSGTVVETEASVAAADVKCIEIDWAAGSISLNIADTDRITFTETAPENAKYKMTYDVSGDTLKLSYGNGDISIGFGNWSFPGKDLVITVPRDWVCEELEIDGAALTIGIHHLTVEKIDLDGASNNLEFVGSLKYADIDGASNHIRLECTNRPNSIDLDGVSCSLELILPENCGFWVQMSGLSCDFHSELAYTSDGGSYSYGDRQCQVNADGVSCDITVSESAECAHVWDSGVQNGNEVLYTCTLCGETKTGADPLASQQKQYITATTLASAGKTAEAAIAFGKLGDFLDSR